MRTSQKRYLVDPVEATAIMLRRLATASRCVDVEPEFGKHRSALSEIFYHALEFSSIANSDRLWEHGQRVSSRCAQGSVQRVWCSAARNNVVFTNSYVDDNSCLISE
jgi:hypothetical protein